MRPRSALRSLLALTCAMGLVVVVAVGWSISTASTASASTVLNVSLDRLAERADRVIRGRVTAASVFLEKGAQRVWTRYQVRVEETLVGPTSKSVVVHVPGGRIGKLEQSVHGVARMKPHDRVVLFLWTDAERRERVLGQAQGLYRVSTDAKTGKLMCAADLNGLVLVGSDGQTESGEGRVRRVSLDVLRRRVAAARAAKAAREEAVRALAERKRRAAKARARAIRERTQGKPGNAK